jgi:hypothetical protein
MPNRSARFDVAPGMRFVLLAVPILAAVVLLAGCGGGSGY